jgi:electron transport complex protein RnfB
MDNEEKISRDLQIHLDIQTIGFPKTPTGSDIDLLKQLFTPAQAEVMMLLTYKHESLGQIQERAKALGKSAEETEQLLDETARRAVIGFRKKDGVKQYRAIPYLVGMLEGAAFTTPTEKMPKLMEAHRNFSADGLFWRDFLNTKIPQFRTIPIQKSITLKHQIGNYDEVRKIVKTTTDPIAVFECVCRSGAEKTGKPCKQTSRKETCMAFRDMAQTILASGKFGRAVSKEEALDILQKNQDDGLVLQPSNAQLPDAICSCCGCCCGLLQLQKFIPNPVSHWATNFFAQVNEDACIQCGICEERCQVGALKAGAGKTATVDLTRCLGCGLCIEACPTSAIELQRKPTETIPPVTGEDMMEFIMSNKPQ